jgi:hypothetical protein
MSLAAKLNAKKQAVAERNAGRQNTYRWVQPETEVRLLPSWRPADHEDPDTFFLDFGQTWIKDLDGKILAVVGDAKITYGEDDVVRNLVGQAIAQSRTDGQRKHYKEMLASPRVLVGGLVLNDPNVDPTEPQILEFSESQFTGPITDLIVKAEKEGDNVLSLDEGFNLTVIKTGKGKEGTKYSFTLARRSSKVDPKVMDKVYDLDAYVKAKFADGARAVNAIKSLIQGEPLALIERSTDLSEDRGSRTTKSEVVDADYDVIDNAREGGTDSVVENVIVSDAEIDALFD